MNMKKIIYVFFLLCCQLALCQEPSFKASFSRDKIGINERVSVKFEIDQDADNFTPPSFQDFNVVMGPRQSVENSWINGKRTFKKSFSYTLEPKRKGTLKVASASIEVNGKIYKTKEITLEVGDEVKNPSKGGQNQNQSGWAFPFGMNPFGFDPFFDDPFFEQDEQREDQKAEVKPNDLFLVAEISNKNPYVNEQLVVSYRLYIDEKIGVGLQDFTEPDFKDFIKHDVEIRRDTKECTYNNRRYRCALMKQVVIIPQKSGRIEINPFKLDLNVQAVVGYDRFGRPKVTNLQKRVSSGTIAINAKELPQEGKPQDFTGAVGQFQMEATLNKKELKTQESVSAVVEVRGEGNFGLFELPQVQFPSDLEVYDPEKKENVKASEQGLRGTITKTYTAIPLRKGSYPISDITFSYFSPKEGKYKTLNAEDLKIEVTQGQDYRENVGEGEGKNVPVVREFGFLKLKPNLKSKDQVDFFGSTMFWTIMGVLALILPVFLAIKEQVERKLADVEGGKIRKAEKMAKKYLGEAKTNIGDKEKFYEMLAKGLTNFVKGKLHLRNSDLTMDAIIEACRKKQVEEQDLEQLKQIMEACDAARYSPYTQNDMEKDYQRARETILKLDKHFRG